MRDSQDVKSQSAMEYLMTYGWAILIIAVVLGALFQLGVFNATNFAPRVPAGACRVERFATQIALAGECQGGLPQYVAQFNGNSGYVVSNVITIPTGSASRTVTAWVNDLNPSSRLTVFWYGTTACANPGTPPEFFQIYIDGTSVINAWCTDEAVPGALSAGQWYFVAYTYNQTSNAQAGYTGLQGNLYSVGPTVVYAAYNTPLTDFYIGNDNGGGWFDGSIANVQVYNSSLSQNEIDALYSEGIGGAPVDLQNLVAWWPLNGNANDYSGNGYSGQEVGGVTYTGAYLSGYTTP